MPTCKNTLPNLVNKKKYPNCTGTVQILNKNCNPQLSSLAILNFLHWPESLSLQMPMVFLCPGTASTVYSSKKSLSNQRNHQQLMDSPCSYADSKPQTLAFSSHHDAHLYALSDWCCSLSVQWTLCMLVTWQTRCLVVVISGVKWQSCRPRSPWKRIDLCCT